MNNLKIILISIGLSMDAFSVSLCKGLSIKNNLYGLILSLSFSIFQMIMPLIGYFLGNILSDKLIAFNHIIAFVLLSVVGINMIKESYKKEDLNNNFNFKELITLSIATSIDALSVGITFSFFKINLIKTIITIGITCFIFSFLGTFIGRIIGNKINNLANIIGGVILILIGLKILLEHFVFS